MLALRPVQHRRGLRGSVALSTAALLSSSLVAVATTAGAHAAAATSTGPSSVHVVTPVTVADTAAGAGVARKALINKRFLTVAIAGHYGIPANATSVVLAALVTRSTGTGQVRLGATQSSAVDAVFAAKGRAATAPFTTLLAKGRLSVGYLGTGKIELRLVVEAYTAGDRSGASFHPIAPTRVADTWKGVGLPAQVIAKRGSVRVQIAGTAGIPRTATGVLLSVNDNNAAAAGAITAGISSHATAPVVTFAKRQQLTGVVLAPLAGDGTVTLVNSSPGTVGLTANAIGYYTPDATGLYLQAIAPDRIADTRTGLALPKQALSTTVRTLGVRSAARLPANAAAATLSLVLPAQGLSAISSGADAAAMSTVLLTSPRLPSATTAVVALGAQGDVSLRATGKPTQVEVMVLGYYAPATLSQKPPAPAPPTTAPPAPAPPAPAPPTTAPPTTAPPAPAPPTTAPPAQPVVLHPRVTLVDPADGATGVDPQTTSVVTDLSLPNGGVSGRSLNSTTVMLVDSTGAEVPATYATSGGADTINVSPTGPLAPYMTYRFTVTEGATDVLGISFQPFTSTFTTGAVVVPANSIAFAHVPSGASGQSFASVTKGPDGKLYASTLDGYILRYDIAPDGTLSHEFKIDTVRTHANTAGFYGAPTRTILGLTFDPASKANNLILWITDDSAYEGTTDPNNYIPDFSDHLAKLTGADLGTYTDVLAGLPRSIKDHETNSIAFHNGLLYVTQGANNAMGAPDATWGNRPEQLLNAAVLRLDPSKLPAQLPLNVATATGGPYGGGSYNPYAAGAPLTIYATGIRNAFDLVWHSNGHLYAPTNGSAAGGNMPGTGGGPATCTNRIDGRTSVPAAPAEGYNPVAETDFVFDVKPGRYYGHPDPARCEYVLDNGNPTAGTDPFEVTKYPAGQQPDPNYDLADVYDAGLHASADGAIEYVGTAFNGALNHKLLVVRYSDGQDIESFDVSSSGPLSNRTVGIKGFTGFTSPLDLAEDPSSGDLYVTELTYPGSIVLLRP